MTSNDQLKTILASLQDQITQLENNHQTLTQQITPTTTEEYTDLKFNVTKADDVSLHLFRTLPEFTGERKNYATWRSMVMTAMKLIDGFKSTMRYCEALMIIRNKISGAASNTLNNYNTPFNFDAMIDRLDFTFADKRPLYVIEQEMLVLQQNKLSIDEFYDKVNEKLNSIINKINMTYKERSICQAFIASTNEKALRTFITGLNNRRGEVLYASNPSSLPEAYARLQTITNDQQRINFANKFNAPKETTYLKNPQFRSREFLQKPAFIKPMTEIEPMEIDHTSTKVHFDQNRETSHHNTPNDGTFKRSFSRNNAFPSTSNQRTKQQRLNNLNNHEAYAKTILEDDHLETINDNESIQSDKTTSTIASIFLEE